jgi:hypothetical protein
VPVLVLVPVPRTTVLVTVLSIAGYWLVLLVQVEDVFFSVQVLVLVLVLGRACPRMSFNFFWRATPDPRMKLLRLGTSTGHPDSSMILPAVSDAVCLSQFLGYVTLTFAARGCTLVWDKCLFLYLRLFATFSFLSRDNFKDEISIIKLNIK